MLVKYKLAFYILAQFLLEPLKTMLVKYKSDF